MFDSLYLWRKRCFSFICAMIGIFFFLSISPSFPVKQKSNRLRHLVTTTTILADWAKNILGDMVNVTALIPPHVDPHLFFPTADILFLLYDADYVVCNGLHLEGKMEEIFKGLQKMKPVYFFGDFIDSNQLIMDQDIADPHFWFSVPLVLEGMKYFVLFLEKDECLDSAVIRYNALSYTKELKQLHNWIRKRMDTVLPSDRFFVTVHNAFSYYGRDYRLSVKTLQGVSTAQEVALNKRLLLSKFLKENGVRVVFSEMSALNKYLKAVQEDLQREGYIIEIVGPLLTDSLGREDEKTASYIGMMRHNTNIVVRQLKKNGR